MPFDPGAGVLAAADIYVGVTTDRADRPAFSGKAAATELRRLASQGTLEQRTTGAVLMAAAHSEPPAPKSRRPQYPAGLTGREVEVLRLASRGLTTRDRRQTLHLTKDRRPPHPAGLHQDRGINPSRSRPVGDATCRRQLSSGLSTNRFSRQTHRESGFSNSVPDSLPRRRLSPRPTPARAWVCALTGRSVRGHRQEGHGNQPYVIGVSCGSMLGVSGRVAGSYGASVGMRVAWLFPAGCRERGREVHRGKSLAVVRAAGRFRAGGQGGQHRGAHRPGL